MTSPLSAPPACTISFSATRRSQPTATQSHAAAAFVGAIEAFDAARVRAEESGEVVAGEVLRAASMSAMQLGFLSQDAEDWGSAIRWFELGHQLHEQLGEPYEAALAADMAALSA